MAWTEERVEKLKELWAQGLSASQIAKELGGVTRNAVIGKVHRLGLSSRAGGKGGEEKPAAESTPQTAAQAPSPETAAAEQAAESGPTAEPGPTTEGVVPPRDPTQPREPGPPTPEEQAARETLARIEKLAKRITLMELTERTCKWPIGDPTDEDFAFCGLPSVPGKPYCEHHVAVAYQPMSSRRDRARSAR